jgi:restriction system protein
VLVASASAAWFEICKQIDRDPRFRFEFADNPRKFEEFVAGAYVESDFDEVTVTPRSGDRGRDVIAVKSGMCSVRILDQTKAYSLNRLVTHNDVRSILGVVAYTDVNTSKGVITTTSDFEPMIWSSGEFTPLMPYRVDLQNGDKLIQWLRHICEAKKQRRTA